MTIGFIGLGAMGAPMAARLIEAGHRLIVYNRTAARAAPLVERGAVLAASPAEAAAAGVVFTMLTNDAALAAVCDGPEGLRAGLPAGGSHVSCSTISLAAAEQHSAAHARLGQVMLSATVLGRPPAAAAGTLFILAAGPAAQRAAIDPLLHAMGQRVFGMGETASAANLVKLAANFLIFSTIEQLGEVLAITGKAGIDRAAVFEFLTNSFWTAPVHRNYGRLILDRAFEGAATGVELALKDTGLMLAAAEQLAAPMPLASLVRDRLLACAAHGELHQDFAVLARESERGAGLA